MRGLPLKSAMVNTYKREKSQGRQRAYLGLKECQNLIMDLLNEYTHVTILLDALDECENKSRLGLFAFLAKLRCYPKTTVKILISSRSEPDVYECFGGVNNFSINAADNADDIQRYVKHEIQNRLLFGKAKKILRDKVENTLNNKSHGM